MKRNYSKPVVEKIDFDYRIQTGTPSKPQECFGSVINVATSLSECGEGTPNYFGWTLENPGGI